MADKIDFDRPVTSVWSSFWHQFYGSSESASENGRETYESCMTCGATYILQNLGDGQGAYVTGSGAEPKSCSGRTDLVHGYERVCENDNGRGCAADRENGTCEHTDHECDCVQCD